LTCACLALPTAGAWARDEAAKSPPQIQNVQPAPSRVGLGVDTKAPPRPFSAAAAETTWLGSWDFEGSGSCDAQGWVSVDATAQAGDYFHIDDFAGLGGGNTGRLLPIEGNQSLWCGARPSTVAPLCGYAALPGYGNDWNQAFCTAACLSVDSLVTVDYLVSWDSEPGYDATTIEVDACDDNWQVAFGGIYGFDGTGGPEFHSIAVPPAMNAGQMRVRLHFVSDGAWSDQDGLWITDGAIIFDSLSVSNAAGLVLPVEDFEDETVGDNDADDWVSCTPAGYGDFAALFPGTTVPQRDPCNLNLSCLWAFFAGSTADFSCGGLPSQPVVPYGNVRDQYIHTEIWSPTVPWAGSGTSAELVFDVYRELPLSALVFFVWHVRSVVDGCAGNWNDFGFVYYGTGPEWIRNMFPVGNFIEPGATDIQVALGVRDMCAYWCGVYGNGQCHSHSPLFDNVDVYRINTRGPAWTTRDIDMFQDNFATDGTLTGSVRADVALNTNNWSSSHNIIPGDSVVVSVEDPDFGLAPDPYTGTASAVYCYVSVWPQDQAGKTGGALTDNSNRWPVVDSLSSAGDTWYVIRCDSTKSSAGYYNPVSRFCVDLNDNLFTPGDTVCFFFRADSDAPSTDKTFWSRATGTTNDIGEVLTNPMEWTCLPAGGYLRGGDILYCDDFDGRGAQPYFDTAFQMLGIEGLVDRYDTRGPSSIQGNSLGGRVVDVFQQLLPCYRKIIWNSGNLSSGTIGDGSGSPDYADDASVLFTFLVNQLQAGGVYLSGDDLADELSRLSGTGAIQLRSYINYVTANTDHTDAGLGVSPLVIGEPGSMFEHFLGPDTLIAYGGCPLINDFDVLTPMGTATVQASYEGMGNAAGAVIAQVNTNSQGVAAAVVLSGFSYHYIRDTRPKGVPARAEHLRDIIQWLGNVLPIPTGVESTGLSSSLDQNYPNPFNPTTTIEFTLADRAQVSLRVYNVAGQLVRTLVDGFREPGIHHSARWNGTDDRGGQVSSGVYFYKLVTKDYTQTRKMVLLK